MCNVPVSNLDTLDEKRPKRPKTQMWAGKFMASVLWDAHGILFIDYLEKGKTINSERNIGQLMRLKNEIGEKRLQMNKKKVARYHGEIE